MQELFDYCCRIMADLGRLTGFSYKEINVIVFVFLFPIIDVILLIVFLKLHYKHRNQCAFIKQLER